MFKTLRVYIVPEDFKMGDCIIYDEFKTSENYLNKLLNKLIFNEDLMNNLKCAIEKFNFEHANYLRSQLLLNITKEEANSSVLCEKVNNVLILSELQNNTFKLINKNGESFNILGIDPDVSTGADNLSGSEKIMLKSIVKKRLTRFCSDFQNKQKEFETDDIANCTENNMESNMILRKGKIDIITLQFKNLYLINKYNLLIKNACKLLEDITNYKHDLFNKVFLSSTDSLYDSAKDMKIKARIFELKMEIIVLSVDNKTFQALSFLYNSLKKREKNLLMRLRTAESKLSSYDKLKSTEFQTITNQYRDVQKKITHLQWTLNELS
ncbi:uncharacterized protein LOC142325980 [Lycorma delicatula]|uniref:uncharacterized protein LOC142325980 n=1 Tax=Lycorma delicatula TaxID=130591 RepID=UPI003F50D610